MIIKKISLKSLILLLFVLFAVLPLGFFALYSTKQIEKAMKAELTNQLNQQLLVSERYFKASYKAVQAKGSRYLKNNSLLFFLTSLDQNNLEKWLTEALKRDSVNRMAIFDRDGEPLALAVKSKSDGVKIIKKTNTDPDIPWAFPQIDRKAQVQDGPISNLVVDRDSFYLVVTFPIKKAEKLLGFLEQSVELTRFELKKLKKSWGAEVVFLDLKGAPLISSIDNSFKEWPLFLDFINRELHHRKINSLESYRDAFSVSEVFDLAIGEELFGFKGQSIMWGNSKWLVFLGISQKQSQQLLDNLKFAVFSVAAVLGVLLIVTVFFVSSWVLKPLYNLLFKIEGFDDSEPVIQDWDGGGQTEILELTRAFYQMSEKVIAARSELKAKIQELEKANTEIKEAQVQLVQSAKMASLGQLVAGVAHELNNPIGFIYSNVHHLKEYFNACMQLIQMSEAGSRELSKAKQDLDFAFIEQDWPKLMASIEEGARRSKEIVLGLRNFSRLEEAELKETDLHQAIQTTLELLKTEFHNRVRLHFQFNSIPLVWCQSSQINQVLMNLFSNAFQAIDGPGDVWVSTHLLKAGESSTAGLNLGPIEPKAFDRVLVSVQDSGRGIKPEVLERIFDPFFTTKGVGQGTGLGLSISYGIIKSHRGEMRVTSQLGVGTEFQFIIPVESDKRAQSQG